MWLSNPGHMGSWSSPLLSYKATPDTKFLEPAHLPPPTTLPLPSNVSPGGSPRWNRLKRNEKLRVSNTSNSMLCSVARIRLI